jgi:glycosyltransferase involved in cell wall biosynthesis
MKVCEFLNPNWGHAFFRISKALHDYSPKEIEWTDFEHADTYLVHVVGGGEIPEMEKGLEKKKKLIIFQHVYFTGGVYDWSQYWKQALLTVSFHNLKDYTNKDFNFYSTPWGADSKLFSRLAIKKSYKVFTTGHIAETENIDKLYLACKNIKQTMYHTGTNFEFGEYYKYLPFLNDREFVVMLNGAQYISCLRDIEGFEMMGVEGLFCGARPIVPDLPTYRWYKDHGIFIDMNKDIVKQLEIILNSTPEEPSPLEMKEIHNKFSWQNLIPRIFQEIK